MRPQRVPFAVSLLLCFSVVLAMSMLACSEPDPTTLTIDFRQSSHGWVGDFADYPVGEDAFCELETDDGATHHVRVVLGKRKRRVAQGAKQSSRASG
jgi:hypothetical protein